MKRLFDCLVILVFLPLAIPALLLVAIGVALTMGSPVLFTQTRAGKDGQPFDLIKFRSMRDAIAPDGKPLPDGERLTKCGKMLRATSLDELPELWNVLRGEMSLVGPRPLLMQYLPLYSPEQARRHEVRPGITGWAQINGRNALSWEEKFALDIWYVDNRSALLDMRILWLTIAKVLQRDGISAAGEATMLPFSGTQRTEQ